MCAGLLVCAVMVKTVPPKMTVMAPVRAKFKLSGDSIATYRGGIPRTFMGYDSRRQLQPVCAIEFNEILDGSAAELSVRPK